jgi:hypothetical protein
MQILVMQTKEQMVPIKTYDQNQGNRGTQLNLKLWKMARYFVIPSQYLSLSKLNKLWNRWLSFTRRSIKVFIMLQVSSLQKEDILDITG